VVQCDVRPEQGAKIKHRDDSWSDESPAPPTHIVELRGIVVCMHACLAFDAIFFYGYGWVDFHSHVRILMEITLFLFYLLILLSGAKKNVCVCVCVRACVCARVCVCVSHFPNRSFRIEWYDV
jgi:hypothetical protein